MTTLKNMNDTELLEEFENAIRFWHYDYNMKEPIYSLEDFREEIINRVGKTYHPLNDPD